MPCRRSFRDGANGIQGSRPAPILTPERADQRGAWFAMSGSMVGSLPPLPGPARRLLLFGVPLGFMITSTLHLFIDPNPSNNLATHGQPKLLPKSCPSEVA